MKTYRFRTLEHEFDGVKTHFDDEVQQREECCHQLNKVWLSTSRLHEQN